jgi:hypothetical protein
MSTFVAFLVALALLFVTEAEGKTHFVYWNSTNPLFRIDKTDHVVDVNSGNLPWEYDQLNLICPNSEEQHVIYSVSREEYMDCRVTSPRPKIVAICNRPERFLYFTITFRSFSPTPGGLEFKPGHTYYLISTSTTRDIHRRAGGYCSTHNMKMVFNVADNRAAAVNTAVEENNNIETGGAASINVPRSYSFYQPVIASTTEEPRVWSARVPQHRSDYIYYYKPWTSQKNKFIKIEPLSSGNSVEALPLTASAASSTTSLAMMCLATVAALLAVRRDI